MTDETRKNRLARETSPYLLQHAANPVDWYPWGEQALTRSRAEDKPILLSVGYSACHWCHVMERESFEDEDIAALMNASFVCIKVDREERPDVDEIYMNAVQIMTGSGGWPLTVFLTPELEPFYGGTYFPPDDRWGRPGFRTVLRELAKVYAEERDRIEQAASDLTDRLQSLAPVGESSNEKLSLDLVRAGARELASRFDSHTGGFSAAPKFPPSGALSLLLRYHSSSRDPDALQMVELTLDEMAAGGLFDQLGGGFHRYSTDARWLVPHFEKMLYDNALLARVYLEAFQRTENAEYARVASETLDWVLREMQDEQGGYYSSLDADSEGVEGKFYVWTEQEIRQVLGDDAEAFCQAYDVTTQGNWEGHTILNRPRSFSDVAERLSMGKGELEERLLLARNRLLAARDERPRPGLDDKVLTSWNGLMVIAMARGFRILGERKYLESARRAARFLRGNLLDGGRLLATYRLERAKLKAYLDDYAFLLGGFVELFESDFDLEWLSAAQEMATGLSQLFRDRERGGFFFTGDDHEKLIARTKTGFDGAIPSGNAMAAAYLFRLSVYTGSRELEELAVGTLQAFHGQMQRSPGGFAHMLMAVDLHVAPSREIVVVGPADSAKVADALEQLWRLYAPHIFVARLDPMDPNRAAIQQRVPLLSGKTGGDSDAPRFYLCENYACQAPTDSLEEILESIQTR